MTNLSGREFRLYIFVEITTLMYMYVLILSCVLQDEAFELWQHQWGRLYPEGSSSRLVIDGICKNFYLVNLVDNDFIKGNCLWEALQKTVRLRELHQNNHAVQT